MEDDTFKNYYEASLTSQPAEEPDEVKDESVVDYAKLIKAPINDFIHKMNKLVSSVFEEEKEKGTKPDLVATLTIGGLAFTAANVYMLLSRDMGTRMSKEAYLKTFLRMYESALGDIKDEE